ncbi:hypothetical protein NQ315_010662 [Exocentrus adspersus]|uniref:CWH43-like N-terminal domain-containing protein n=1 Tax=Exocentrus adspersus TaxID=1586481 RepID=A0AAV8W569_9CUCU|nr:hypothetical protein NQ315_010662 [Exocentrus adspersus]
MEISVKYLPVATVCFLLLTIIITLCLSLSNKHVVGSLPYISDTGTIFPESCIFGQALNILWLLHTISWIVYIKYKQVRDILSRYDIKHKKKVNKICLQIGLAAAFGVSLAANFQETNLFYIHWCGIFLSFGLGAVYQCMEASTYCILYVTLRKILGQKKITYLRIILSAFSVITFIIFFICAIIAYKQKEDDNYLIWSQEDGGFVSHNISVISEWICAISTLLNIGLLHWEFKKITLYEPDVFVEDKITTEMNMERTNKVTQGHVSDSIPYISDTGTLPPESCIFGQALNILWVIISLIMYIKYLQVNYLLNKFNMGDHQDLNRRTLDVGLFAAFGSSIVANFQETNLFLIHWGGAVTVFGIGAAYQCMQTILYVRLIPVLGQKKLTKVRIGLATLSSLSFLVFFVAALMSYYQKRVNDNYLHWKRDDGGYELHNVSVIFEWICASSTMAYLTLFLEEFKNITLNAPDVYTTDGHISIEEREK